MTDIARVPKRKWSVRMRNFRGPLVVFTADETTRLELNDVGRFMFRAMDGVRTVVQIGELVAQEYDIPPEEAIADVQEFAEELAEANIVDLLPADPPVTAAQS
ncbi:MAG: hypothetical protein V7603_1153 [Micromonosporaceae bacterium]